MARIVLSGHLAERFGAEWNLEVNSVREAMQALDANTEGFQQALIRKDIYGYHVFLDDSDIDENKLADPLGGRTIRIVPVIKGSKNILGSIILIIVAVVLLVVSYGSSSYLSGALISTGLADTAAGAAVASAIASAVSAIALSMLISGVTSLLSPQKKSKSAAETAANTPNDVFSGPINTTAQGHPVPLGYGRLVIGAATISAGLYADQTSAGLVSNGTGGGGADSDGGDGGTADPVVVPDGPNDGLYVGAPIAGKGIDGLDGLIGTADRSSYSV